MHPLRLATVSPEELYLDLLKGCLNRSAFGGDLHMLQPAADTLIGRAYLPVQRLLHHFELRLVSRVSAERVAAGKYWPATAETMLSQARLDNIQESITAAMVEKIPGDLIETGVWRGGATILMAAVLAGYGDTTRRVWVADSFKGLPRPDAAYAADASDQHWKYRELAVSLDEVRANFARYGLLDEQVWFLPGWFADTLPAAPIERLAVLRLDGDMYGSTMDALVPLYPKVSPGGFVIIDDYELAGCRQAVDEYRVDHGIRDELVSVDHTAVFWRKR